MAGDDHTDNEHTSLLPALLGRVAHEGESGRSGFHFKHFIHVSWLSSNVVSQYVNLLWPFAILAPILFHATEAHSWIFFASYLGMIPAANLLGFSGQEFARKMPKVAGILIETTFGSIVEIILFTTLIVKHRASEKKGNGDEGNLIPIIQAAILGSILTNLLLCLGLCFIAGGLKGQVQKFHNVVSETGTGLLLVAGFGLLIPSAFYSALKGEASVVGELIHGKFTRETLDFDVLKISQFTSILLIGAFISYLVYNARSAHSIFDEVIESDEHRDSDREQDAARMRYTGVET